MEEKKVSTLFEEIKDDLSDYVSKRLRLSKLQTYSKVSKSGASLLYSIGAIMVIALVLNFIFATLAFYIGDILNSLTLGFAIVSVLIIIITTIIFMRKNSIKRSLTNKIVSFLMDDDKE